MNKLFIHIPKTAGMSLFSQLQKEGMELYLDYNKFRNKGDACFGHIDVRKLLKYRIISKEYWDNTKAFCVVRNPYDRFVSLYHDFLQSGRIFPDTTLRKFATTLVTVRRKPGLYNVEEFSQTASQNEWILPGVEIKRFEEITKDLPHLNRSTKCPYMEYYNSELLSLVTDLYADDFAILNYPIL